jgi:hypothetical protein
MKKYPTIVIVGAIVAAALLGTIAVFAGDATNAPPLKALCIVSERLVTTGQVVTITCVLTNPSPMAVTVCTSDGFCQTSWQGESDAPPVMIDGKVTHIGYGGAGVSGGSPRLVRREDFIILKSGEVFTQTMTFGIPNEPNLTRVNFHATFVAEERGTKWGLDAWIGTVESEPVVFELRR